MEYILQRRPMRYSFGHYDPAGKWEDLERYANLKIAMEHLSKVSYATNIDQVSYIFRIFQKI